ncbi:MAG: tRNA preQ1(34) S-adenosylmethionine ribosyltransferase-isomerase QueA [Candidatus Obscuribacterales bacterium]|nr:tRNA preQ1(34) S-adenosylmethionine ribosyltransferase-isomerase QueA [Candidatus Obscuribacterales bacterium]
MSDIQDESIAQSLSLDDFSYDLPSELIAQEPCGTRHESRLLVLNKESGELNHHVFKEIRNYLRPGDVLVLNDTKVIPARITARRASGGAVEVLLLKAEAHKPGIWQAMAYPLRKLRQGDSLFVDGAGGKEFVLKVADFVESPDGQRRLLIDFGGQQEVYSLLAHIGSAPLPPYIRRQRPEGDEEARRSTDLERYQTVFAKTPGAVAAPTAGLHFSAELLHELKEQGVEIAYLTLHVGPGTFKPISHSVEEHSIEAEEFNVPADTAHIVNKALDEGRRVIAVGTTSLRTLETAGSSGRLQSGSAESTLYVKPGYGFKIVKALITNFHLSRSSLLVLVSAFAGHEKIMPAYKIAVEQKYRFYSYGDAMFIE